MSDEEVLYSAKHWATKAQKAAQSIPTVNNSTITVKQGGVTKGSFTLNQSSDGTVELDAGSGGGIPDPTGHSGEFLSNDGTDLNWASVNIPTVNNATLTIQKNGTSVATFTANSATNATANITVPTQASDIGAQEALVSGTNIKTINNTSLLGSGDITITQPTVNDGTLTIQHNGTTVDTFTANSATNKTINIKTPIFNLFDFKWTDYELGDQSWLRADTYSWQDGTVYTNAYNHLVDDLSTATQNVDGLVEWTQPVLTGATTSTDLGDIIVTCSGNYSGYDGWKAMDGIKSGTDSATGWGTANSNSGWWQVKFPYKLLITGLKGYQRYDTTPANANTVGRFYTSSSKETPIGDEYSNATSTNWSEVEVTGIPSGGIVTDTIYFEKTSAAYGGLGELEITASRVTSDYIIPYYEAQDGHKIVLPEYEQAVLDLYNAIGVAWYYILDTTNTRFKLPRTKYGFTGYRDTVGNYVPETLPDHRHTIGLKSRTDLGNGGRTATQFDADSTAYTTFASESNSTYQTNAPVQQRATQMYLYFYVGQFSQSATEQTAGLNSELFNGKLDLDVGNATSSTKSTIVGWGMPNWSAGVSLGTGGTALSRGYVVLNSGTQNVSGGIANLDVKLNGTTIYSTRAYGNSGGIGGICFMVESGDVISASGNMNSYEFKFYPLKGN